MEGRTGMEGNTHWGHSAGGSSSNSGNIDRARLDWGRVKKMAKKKSRWGHPAKGYSVQGRQKNYVMGLKGWETYSAPMGAWSGGSGLGDF